MTPHPYAQALHALIDGEEVQVREMRPLAPWQTVDRSAHMLLNPACYEWRLKPATLRCRVALMRSSQGRLYSMIATTSGEAGDYEAGSDFIRWLVDWQEVEA